MNASIVPWCEAAVLPHINVSPASKMKWFQSHIRAGREAAKTWRVGGKTSSRTELWISGAQTPDEDEGFSSAGWRASLQLLSTQNILSTDNAFLFLWVSCFPPIRTETCIQKKTLEWDFRDTLKLLHNKSTQVSVSPRKSLTGKPEKIFPAGAADHWCFLIYTI